MKRFEKNFANTPLILRVVYLYLFTSWIIAMTWMAFFSLKQLDLQDSIKRQALVSESIAKTKLQNDEPEVIQGDPIKLVVSKFSLELPVKHGQYDSLNESWTLSDSEVFFAKMTSLPNNLTGNTFIYGHNTKKVFAPLEDLAIGDIAKIITVEGNTFYYSYYGDDFASPDDVTVLYTEFSNPTLTLMTCEPPFNSIRRLMRFNFIGVE